MMLAVYLVTGLLFISRICFLHAVQVTIQHNGAVSVQHLIHSTDKQRHRKFSNQIIADNIKPDKHEWKIKMRVKWNYIKNEHSGRIYKFFSFTAKGGDKYAYLKMAATKPSLRTGTQAPNGLKWYVRDGRGYHRDSSGWSDRITIVGEHWYDLVYSADLSRRRGLLKIKNVDTDRENEFSVVYPKDVGSKRSRLEGFRKQSGVVDGEFKYLTFINGPEFLPNERNYGYVNSFSEFYCDHKWTERNTKVVCASLTPKTSKWKKFIAHKIEDLTILPPLDFNTLTYLPSPRCDTKGVKDLEACAKQSSCGNPPVKKPVAVLCLDTGARTKVDIGSEEHRKFLLQLGGLTVCDSEWYEKMDSNEVTELCNKYYPNTVHGGLEEYTAGSGNTLYVARITCPWKSITDTDDILFESDILFDGGCACSMSRGCPKTYAIMCAKCDDAKLKSILSTVTLEGTDDSVSLSVSAAKQLLTDQCQPWDCSGPAIKQYPAYCKVYDTLLNLQTDLARRIRQRRAYYADVSKDDVTKIRISSNTAHLDLLRHELMKQNFKSLKSNIRNIIADSPETVSDFFSKLAQYDDEVAQSDLTYAFKILASSERILRTIQTKLDNDLLAIIKYVKQAKTLDNYWNHISFLLNPIQWLSASADDFGDLEVVDGLESLISSLVRENNMRQMEPILTKVESLAALIRDTRNYRKRFVDLVSVLKDLRRRNTEEIKLKADEAKHILVMYLDFTPAITKDLAVKYGTILTQVVEDLCVIVRNTELSASLALGANHKVRDSCRRGLTNLQIVTGMQEEMQEQQLEVLDAFVSSARATVARNGAEDIKSSLTEKGDSLLGMVRNVNILFTIRDQKQILVENACNLLTYTHHGQELPTCAQLRTDPEKHVELGELLYTPPLGTKNMCECPNCQSKQGIFLIPAFTSDPGENEKRHAMFDTSKMYEQMGNQTQGSIFFRIPDETWLHENGWISVNDKGPFFLEKFLVVLPPESSSLLNYQVKMRLLYSTLKGRKYQLEDGISVQNHVTLNPLQSQCDDSRSSPYSIPEFGIDMGEICVSTPGEVSGMLLPTLERSMWKITFQSDQPLKQLYPAAVERNKTTLYIKAIARFCFMSDNSNGPTEQQLMDGQKRSIIYNSSLSICPENEFFDIISNIESGSDVSKPVCEPCPEGSEAMLSHYFCERCPTPEHTHNIDKRYYGCARRVRGTQALMETIIPS